MIQHRRSIADRLARLFRCTITQTPRAAVPLHTYSRDGEVYRVGDSMQFMTLWNEPKIEGVLFIDHPHIIDMLNAGYSPWECKKWQLENDATAVPLHSHSSKEVKL